MTSKLVIALSACVLAGTGVAWHEARAARATATALVRAKEQRTEVEATIRRAEERLLVLAAEQANLQARLAQAGKTPAPRAAEAIDTQPSARSFKNPFNVIHEDPKLQARWFASRRAALIATYGPFFRSVGRTNADLVKFTDLALRREETNLDLSATMWQQHLPQADPALIEGEARAKIEFESAVADLLGASDAQRLRDYELTLPARNIVAALAGVCAMAGEPLAIDQAENLTRLLADASGRYLRTGVTDVQTIDWQAIDRRARDVLTPAQLTLFQTVEPEDGFNLYTFRFGSHVASLTNQAKRAAAGLPPVSSPSVVNPIK